MGSKLMQMVNNLALNFSATLLRTSAAGKIYCTSLKKFVKWGDFFRIPGTASCDAGPEKSKRNASDHSQNPDIVIALNCFNLGLRNQNSGSS